MYFDHEETVSWARHVRDIVLRSTRVQEGQVELIIFPSFPSISTLANIFRDVPVSVGAQNVAAHRSGAFTGEVGIGSLKQVGCTHIEIGHAERRRIFGESMADIQNKIRLTLESGLTPLLCVGESEQTSPSEAAATCIRYVQDALGHAPTHRTNRVIFAYEPEWAIGAAKPADTGYVQEVTREIRNWISTRPELAGSSILYGGSAGPGVLSSLASSVDGLFLGRFAHDPKAILEVINEVSPSHSPGSQGSDPSPTVHK